MKFYVFEPYPKEVKVEIRPTLIKAKDTTNDSFSCVLKANTRELPFKPMTQFQVQYDDNTTQMFWIINDSVSIFSLKPLTYKHSLTLVQYRYFLHKHLVRNTVFNQPRIKNQKLFLSTTCSLQSVSFDSGGHDVRTNFYSLVEDGNQTSGAPAVWVDTIGWNQHTKVKNAYIKTRLFGIKPTGENSHQMVEIKSLDELSQYYAGIKNNTEIQLRSTYSLYTFNPFDYFGKRKSNDVVKNIINNTLNNITSLTLGYDVGGVSTGVLSDTAFMYYTGTGTGFGSDAFDYVIVMQVEVELELYNYTMYEVIETLLNQYKLDCEDSRFSAQRPQLFNLPVSGALYDLLTNTYPMDNLTITQGTWYEALTEIFKFYDAGFKFSGTTLDIEYYNDPENERDDLNYISKSMAHSDKGYNNGKVLCYQNNLQKVELTMYNTRSSTLGVPQKSEYAIVLPKPIYDVNKVTLKVVMNSRIFHSSTSSKTTYLNFDLDLTHFFVNNDIWTTLNKEQIQLNSAFNFNQLYQENTIPFERGSKEINISSYYKSLFNIENGVMNNVISFAVRRFFGITSNHYTYYVADIAEKYDNEWLDQNFNIDYIAITNGRAELQNVENKYRGQELVNQNDGLIDIAKAGINIYGESLKDGQPTLTTTCQFTDWDNRIKEGDYIIYNGARWVANVVNISALKDGVYQATIEFSKNFNALSLRVRSDNEKRLTSISSEEAVISEDSYTNYIYVYDTPKTMTGQEIVLGMRNIENLLDNTFDIKTSITNETDLLTFDNSWTSGSEWHSQAEVTLNNFSLSELESYSIVLDDGNISGSAIQAYPTTSTVVNGVKFYARVDATAQADLPTHFKIRYTLSRKNKNVEIGTITPENVGLGYEDIYIPLIKYGFGNTICFEMQMDHPLNAGNQLTKTSGWFGIDKYYSEAVPYTDNNGWLDEVTIDFYSITQSGKKSGIGSYPKLQQNITLPGISGDITIPLLELMGGIWRLKYYKKPNEIFALNYQWCFLSYDLDNFFIGSKFINENSTVLPDKMEGKKFYLRYTTTSNAEKYAIMDIKGKGTNVVEINKTGNVKMFINEVDDNKIELGILSLNADITATTWAIVDEQNDIYFASNNAATFTADQSTTKVITFTTRQNRL